MTNSPEKIHIHPAVAREGRKAMDPFWFIRTANNLGSIAGKKAWSAKDNFERDKHDVTIMRLLDRNALKFVRLELLDKRSQIVCGFKTTFNADGVTSDFIIDSAEGVELPFGVRRLVHSTRFIVNGPDFSKPQPYAAYLYGNWSRAKQLQQAVGRNFQSEHQRKVTKGHQDMAIFVADAARDELVVTSTGDKGFAFAQSGDTKGIFCHIKFAEGFTYFLPRQRLSALVVQTPRGLQARDIRPA